MLLDIWNALAGVQSRKADIRIVMRLAQRPNGLDGTYYGTLTGKYVDKSFESNRFKGYASR